jgi:hypothetical protein
VSNSVTYHILNFAGFSHFLSVSLTFGGYYVF